MKVGPEPPPQSPRHYSKVGPAEFLAPETAGDPALDADNSDDDNSQTTIFPFSRRPSLLGSLPPSPTGSPRLQVEEVQSRPVSHAEERTALKSASLKVRNALVFTQSSTAKEILYPGTLSDRIRYSVIRFAPPVVILIWLLIPLGTPTCAGMSPNNQSIFMFLLTTWLIYCLIAYAVGWAAFRLILGPQSATAVLATSWPLIVAIGSVFINRYFESSFPSNILLPLSVLFGAMPLPLFFVLSARRLQKAYDKAEITGRAQTAVDPHFLRRVFRLALCLGFFLVTFAFCQAFSIGYEYTLSNALPTPGGFSVGQLATILFTVLMTLLKAVMQTLSESLDLVVDPDSPQFRVLFLYVSDLFYFFFSRSLFMSVSSYEAFLPLSVGSLLFDYIFARVKATRWWYEKQDKVLSAVFRRPRSVFDEAKFARYLEHMALDFFFRSVAEFISLFAFTAGFAFIYYGWNKDFYHFPSSISEETYGLSNALIFITYLPIGIAMEIPFTILMRRFFTNKTGKDTFQLGVSYLQDNAMFFNLFLVTLHVGQDVFIVRNVFNFCIG